MDRPIDTAAIKKYLEALSLIYNVNTYTERGKEALAKLSKQLGIDYKTLFKEANNFYDKKTGWYVPPYFIGTDREENHPHKDKNVDTTNDLEAQYHAKYGYKSKTNRNKRKDELSEAVKNFEMVFQNQNTSNLLFIQGVWGGGKSTYLYKLINDDLSSEIKPIMIICNIEKAEERKVLFNIVMEAKNKAAIDMFKILVVYHIQELIVSPKFSIIKIIDNFHRLGTKQLINKFSLPRKVKETIQLMEKHREPNSMEEFLNVFGEKIICEIVFNNSNDDDLEKITSLLSIYVTLSVLSEYSDSAISPRKIIVVFDGIEHVIKESSRIFDEDIEKLFNCVFKFHNDFIGAFPTSVKFITKSIFVARDTTYDMIRNENKAIDMIRTKAQGTPSDNFCFHVNIDDWFDFSAITRKRQAVIKKLAPGIIKPVLTEINVDEIYSVILDDKDSRRDGNSLIEMLGEMYNGDIRCLSLNLFNVLKDFTYEAQSALFVKFAIYWEEKIMDKRPNDRRPTHINRYLCRRAILRLFFNRIKNATIDGKRSIIDVLYFGEQRAKEYEYMTMARRILLFLLSKTKNNDIFLSLEDVVEGVLRPQESSIRKEDDNRLEIFSNLIFSLSDIALLRPESVWSLLVNIKYNVNESTFSYNLLKDKVTEIWCNNKEHTSNIKLRLTSAGEFLSYIQSDYEFFAARINSNGVPLMFTRDIPTIKKTLDDVYKKAIDCVCNVLEYERENFNDYEAMYNNDTHYLYLERDDIKRPHSLRVLTNHIIHLTHYKLFILNQTAQRTDNDSVKNGKKLFSAEDGNDIITSIEYYGQKYCDTIKALSDGNDTYTDLGNEVKEREIDLKSKNSGRPYLYGYFRQLKDDETERFKNEWYSFKKAGIE